MYVEYRAVEGLKMPILPEELQKKLEIVEKWMKNGKFIDGTPEYVLEYDREIAEFYIKESEGAM